MTLTPTTIRSAHGARRTSKRVGRGNGSGRGTYSGRGMKGQRARSGGRRGLARLGFKSALQKAPKTRGFQSIHPKMAVVSLRTLERVCAEGEQVTPAVLEQKGAIRTPKFGVKIVATGTLTKKLTITDCVASKKAVELIEKAGGNISF